MIEDLALQLITNATQSLTPVVQQVADQASNNTNALIGVAGAVASGLVGKHFLYDTKQTKSITQTAADIDKTQMIDQADNYNDFDQFASAIEDWLRLIMNPLYKDLKPAEILELIIDDVTKQTMGQKLVALCRDIHKYNIQYYKNTDFKPNSIAYNSKNPLKNVRNLVKDMTTATP